jgi:probable selenate reductase molybdenum-binding subunit
MTELKNVGRSVRKVDAISIAAGRAVYTDDIPLENPLQLLLLHSPHAHAEILSIDTSEAMKIDGVVDILTHENTPPTLYTTAGQGYPEPSPYDFRMFDSKVRFVGDRVALMVAETMEAAQKALPLIKVEYRELPPVFDPELSMEPDSPAIHDESAYAPLPVRYDPGQNLAAEVELGFGDMDKGFSAADHIEDNTYTTQYASHCAMEPHASAAFLDEKDRLVIVTSTQVPFHVRRTLARVLEIPLRSIRVIKPRVGGAFGGKQEIILEPMVAFVTWKHRRASRLILSRKEVFTFCRTRHPFRIRFRTGFLDDGTITAMDVDALMNTGAYGAHALTVLSNSGSKMLPLFNKVENVHFIGRSVYTNSPVGGAYRGYGATQAYFGFNQQLDIIARKTGQDLLEFAKKWHIRKGETSEVFRILGEGTEGVAQYIRSCGLDECIDRGAEKIRWHEIRNRHISHSKDRVRGVGMAISMQGSAIPLIDMASSSMKMNEDGSFNLYVGATDLGTGSDTVLSQIAAEVLGVPVEKIIILSSDTDLTPFDVGAYASSTTYLSGKAVEKCAHKIKEQIMMTASGMLEVPAEDLIFGEGVIYTADRAKETTLEQVCTYALYTKNQYQIQANASHVAEESPPPFMAQFAEVEVDTRTGEVRVVHFVSAVDCGKAINPRLAEGQVEGAAINGISYALHEDYIFSGRGRMLNDTFWDYKIFTAPDIPEMDTIIVESGEETGPFGAKSVSEIGLNGPMPAIANAIYDAVGIRLFDAPFTPDKVMAALRKK